MKPTAAHTDRVSLTIGWLAIAIWCAAWWIIYRFVPVPGLDDMRFALGYSDWLTGRSDTINWAAAFDTIRETYLYDNARLANVVVVFAMMLPKWVRVLISTMVMLMFVIQARSLICNDKARSALPMVALLCLYRVVLPWREQMEGFDFMANYMVPSVLMFALYIYLMADSGRKYPSASTLIVALLLGFWHEGFAFPAAVSLFIWGLVSRSMRQRTWLLLLVMLPGMAYQWCAPAMTVRINSSNYYYFDLYGIIRMNLIHTVAWIAVLMAVLSLVFRKKLRLQPGEAHFRIACIAAIIASLYMQSRIPQSIRVGWVSEMMGSIVIVRMFVLHCADCQRRNTVHVIAQSGAVVLLALLTYSLTASVMVSLRQHKEDAEIRRLIEMSDTDEIYYDVLRYWQMPPAALQSPSAEYYTGPYYKFLTGTKEDVDVKIVPTVFKHLPQSRGRKIPGNNPFYHIDGYIYGSDSSIGKDDVFWTFDFANGKRHILLTRCHFTDKEGNGYYFVWPYRCYWGIRSGIKAIDKD